MTYQSPGLVRSSAFSATAGSTSSAGSASAAAGVSAVGAASAVSSAGASAGAPVVSATSTGSPVGVSPSKVVTVVSPSLITSLAEHQHHQPGESEVRTGDQRHHEDQKRQHHRGVGDHLLAVRPDHLAKFADDLDRKSTRLNSSHVAISYAVFC